ncbi:MAG: hypothetical protein LBV49_12145 [Azonexus sp.]|nr:hypothetical protein [Azonexus sp.]
MRGISLVTAIFLLVILALLSAAIARFYSTQNRGLSMDALAVKADQAALAGIEWARFLIYDPTPGGQGDTYRNSVCNGQMATETTAAIPGTPVAVTGLSDFQVSVTCSQALTQSVEGLRTDTPGQTSQNQTPLLDCNGQQKFVTVFVYDITSAASNSQSAPPGSPNYAAQTRYVRLRRDVPVPSNPPC